jgi:hypothetical protein
MAAFLVYIISILEGRFLLPALAGAPQLPGIVSSRSWYTIVLKQPSSLSPGMTIYGPYAVPVDMITHISKMKNIVLLLIKQLISFQNYTFNSEKLMHLGDLKF